MMAMRTRPSRTRSRRRYILHFHLFNFAGRYKDDSATLLTTASTVTFEERVPAAASRALPHLDSLRGLLLLFVALVSRPNQVVGALPISPFLTQGATLVCVLVLVVASSTEPCLASGLLAFSATRGTKLRPRIVTFAVQGGQIRVGEIFVVSVAKTAIVGRYLPFFATRALVQTTVKIENEVKTVTTPVFVFVPIVQETKANYMHPHPITVPG
mmetsp:Transcript_51106/g.76345  ORF Transcript_51106/g.76345 Transcript_51106/m.76345 type:complete len:213 (-) Transcript_51106:1503-2141(-)